MATDTFDADIIREFGTPSPEHGALPLYQSADYCGHPEPPEPDTPDDTGWSAWDEWHGDHPASSGFNGEPICLLTPAGEFCPACTVVAREEEDLPVDEYVACRVDPIAPDMTGKEG